MRTYTFDDDYNYDDLYSALTSSKTHAYYHGDNANGSSYNIFWNDSTDYILTLQCRQYVPSHLE